MLYNNLDLCLSMAPHSSTLAWRIPWTEEPGGLQSMGSLRVRHNWATSLSLFTFMHWRRKWQPTPVFLPGESQGRGSLVGCHLWGRIESGTTEVTKQQQQHSYLYSHMVSRVEDNWNCSQSLVFLISTGKMLCVQYTHTHTHIHTREREENRRGETTIIPCLISYFL